MSIKRWPWRAVLVGACLAMGLIATAYAVTAKSLAEARVARRNDDYVLAERHLASCWPLPGMNAAREREDQLIAVQQGDLRNEKNWQSQPVGSTSDRTEIWEALAKGKLATFQWEAARKDADLMLARDPTNARALWLRGCAEVEMQQEPRARRDFEDALKIAPEDFEIRNSLAELLHKQGYVREAIEHYRKLAAQRPGDPQVILALAHSLQDQSELATAQQLVDQLLATHPDSVQALVERGRLALRAGDGQTAEDWLRRAVALSPDHADANFVLRLALQAQQKEDQELDSHVHQNELRQAKLKTLLQSRESKPKVLTDIGLWMLRTGFDHEVLGWLYLALKEDSAFQPAHRGLAEFYRDHGQIRRARWHAMQAGMELEERGSAIDADQASRLASVGDQSQPPGTVAHGALTSMASSDEVHRLCAACHAYPLPETMPRSAWRKEVKQGYDFLRASNLSGDFPSLESVVAYYEHAAPQNLPTIEPLAADETNPVTFEKRGTGYVPRLPPHPGVANVNLANLFHENKQDLIICETRLDALMLLRPYDNGPGGNVIPGVAAPCHTTVSDLDQDGRQDILVASLGSFFPTDDKLGRVLWLQGKAGNQFDAVPLLNGVGRVSDVQVADFSGDGKLDIVVAVFGWRNTGEILFLENRTTDWSTPEFTTHVIDTRHGAIHVPVCDLNQDGRLDFVAVISQQHEMIVAYLNQGDGRFEPQTIFAAEHPSYGCSGIEVVDLDGDRDLDVLLTNGDILDPPYLLKPYHGVQWLENTGAFPYTYHRLAEMYGVARAVAADFDGDGDRDVAAVTFLPALLFPDRQQRNLPSVVLFEQRPERQFVNHILESGTCDHFSCAAGDWDSDGAVDLVVANYSWNGSRPMSDAATLWKNMGRRR